MSTPMVFVQARMGSSRFPGKVLAPLGDMPLIERVIGRVAESVPRTRIVLCTTVRKSDDVLADYMRQTVSVFRGEADNAVGRFQYALKKHPCDRFFRVCGDSPLLDPGLFARFLAVPGNPDLVTNIFPRTFPKGQSLELIRSDVFASLDSSSLSAEQREHPTRYFYDNWQGYSIVNIEDPVPDPPVYYDVAVDTIEDLHRIEAML